MSNCEFYDTHDASIRVRTDKNGAVCVSIVSDNSDDELKVALDDKNEFADWLELLAKKVRKNKKITL